MGLASIIDKIDFGSLGNILTGAGTLIKDIRTAITGKAPLDPTKLAELELKAAELEAKRVEIEAGAMNAQVELNKIEAASTSLFKSGWRPAAGWLCVSGLGWSTFIYPVWTWLAKVANIPTPPALDTGVLISLLVAMLGLGGYRTYEKTKNGKVTP